LTASFKNHYIETLSIEQKLKLFILCENEFARNVCKILVETK
jgi:hypothetical protein